MNTLSYFLSLVLFTIGLPHTLEAQIYKSNMENDKKLMENIRNGFEQIIQYHMEKGELHQRASADVSAFSKYLEDQTEFTRRRLSEVIEKINYETIQPHEKYKAWPDLEFWRGMDDFGSSAALNYGGDVDILNGQEPVVKGRHDSYEMPSDSARLVAEKNKKSIKIDLDKYPVSILGHYEYKFNETALYYAWISYLWQEVEGYKCGIRAKTVQNNSIETFSLNDYLDSDFSSFVYHDHEEKPQRLTNFFPRKLSLIELYLRASQTGYPFNPYWNYWRYFEKGNQFMEIVTYEFSTGIRQGNLSERQTAKVNQILKHESSGNALKHITAFTNQMIFEGWEEKLRPIGMPTKMHQDAYDFEIWTGINWSDEQTNMLPKEQVASLEDKFGIDLPNSFFHYLRLLNGRQYNSYHMHFPINDLYTIQVKKFYTIDELKKFNEGTLNKNSPHLWIGELVDERKLGVSIDKKSSLFGQVAIAKDGKIETCDYTFEKFAKYAQGSPKQPELFAAEENDTEFLRKRLSEGWDYNTSYDSGKAVDHAAQSNSHEALELLLKAGARLRHTRHREMPYLYDEKTMELLDKYKKD
jgi:hypothetical protein